MGQERNGYLPCDQAATAGAEHSALEGMRLVQGELRTSWRLSRVVRGDGGNWSGVVVFGGGSSRAGQQRLPWDLVEEVIGWVVVSTG